MAAMLPWPPISATKRAVGTKGAVDAGEDGLLACDAGDPVEGGVGEDGVELLVVGQDGGVVLLDVEVA